jgi:hypothetical protein
VMSSDAVRAVYLGEELDDTGLDEPGEATP